MALELGAADARDARELLARRGIARGDLDQRAVVEDDIGRDALRAREVAPPRLQRGEQVAIGLGGRRRPGGARAAALALALGGWRRKAQLHAALAAQHGAHHLVGAEAQPAMPLGVRLEQARRDELPEQAAPLAAVELAADAMDREPVVAQRAHALGVGAEQHVDDMRRAEALARAVDRRERLAHGLGRVAAARGLEADVAVPAGLGQALAEMGQQHLAPAGRGLREADQRVELRVLDALLHIARVGLVDEAAQERHVASAMRHPRHRGQPIAPGAPGLLVVEIGRAHV